MPDRTEEERTPRVREALIVVAVIGALVVLAGGSMLYRGQETLLRGRAEEQIVSVGRLKVEELEKWRADRLAEGWQVMNDPGIGLIVDRWLRDGDEQTRKDAALALDALRFGGRYRSVVLVDTDGRELMEQGGSGAPTHPDMLPLLEEALAAREPRLSDIHVADGEGVPHLHVVAPVSATPGGREIGAIILQVDARDFLFPFVQKWPTPSPTAETVLVRREGDRVVFLNDLRHADNPDMSMSLPLTRTDVPVVKAALGWRGIVEGVDYRGHRVFAYLAAVRGSEWLLVAKVDVDDALAPWRGRSTFILALVIALLVLFVGSVALAWQSVKSARLKSVLAAERARRSAESRLAVTLQSVGDAVISTDAEQRIEFMNPVAEQLTGWTAGEAVGRPLDIVFRIFNEDTGEPAESPAGMVLRDGTVVGLANHTVLRARDGSEYAVADSGAPIRDVEGRLTGVVIVFRDQTTERASQRALADSEARFRTLVEGAPDAIFVQTNERFVYVNAAACRLYGAGSEGELIGRPILDVVDPSLHDMVRARIKAINLDRIPGRPIDQLHVRLDGTRVNVEVSAVPVVFDGVDGAVVFVRDVSERKALEHELEMHRGRLEELVVERTAELEALNAELVRATRAKTRFLTSMSHELRTPLNSIIGLSALLAEGMSGQLTADQEEQARVINRSGKHLLALISDVLDISKIEAGKVTLSHGEFDPAALLSEVFDALAPLAAEKGLSLAHHAPAGRVQLRSDEPKVRQILYNLVGNAIKFTDTGGVDMTLDVTPRMVRFVVSDSGPGIPAEERSHIFEAFAQLGVEREDGVERGTGLGLAISREYAELLGGTLEVGDSPTGGACFTLSLPRRPRPDRR